MLKEPDQIIHVNRLKENLSDHLSELHEVIKTRYACIKRVAIAIYDSESDLLKTFISSTANGERLVGYETFLGKVPSLKKIAESKTGRVINSINDECHRETLHTLWIKKQNFKSSYTLPIYRNDELAAFIFFDADQTDVFTSDVTGFLQIFADLISQLYLLEISAAKNLISTIRIASDIARVRDFETGNHLKRMAEYSALIARNLRVICKLSDEYIEYIHLFSPLHDIGKIGIADSILLKPGYLNPVEKSIMRKHIAIGGMLVKRICHELNIGPGLAMDMMMNIVMGHHERGDGSGYPKGLYLEGIPLEARIVAVADVFDALTSVRPYKDAWPYEVAARELRDEAKLNRLDPICVEALLSDREEVESIRLAFAD